MQNTALKVSGILFLLIAVAHLIRFIYGTIVIVGTSVIPVWASGAAFAGCAFLAMWMFRSSCSCKEGSC